MVTDKQKNAVHFCEEWLHISFEGNINSKQDVSDFLSEYLDEAKCLYMEIRYEYETYLNNLDQ
jgi:hypothetical protein